VHGDQIKLKSEHEDMGKENQGEEQGERNHQYWPKPKTLLQPIQPPIQTQTKQLANTPNKSDHLTTTQKHLKLAESGGKTRGVKKVRKYDDNCMKKLKKQLIFYAREGEVNFAFFTNKLMILLMYKKACFNTNDLDHVMPSVAISLL
jgi:hypothetical protein